MPRRSPAEVAEAKGAALKNPQRYRGRSSHKLDPLGPPSPWLTPEQKASWKALAAEVPWLARSDRALVELTAVLRTRLQRDPEGMGVAAIAQLRMCLSQLGATPTDRTKAPSSEPEEPANDPAAEFMH